MNIEEVEKYYNDCIEYSNRIKKSYTKRMLSKNI